MTKPLTGSYLNCLNCNKSCYIPKNRLLTFKFCSRSCGALYVRISIKRNCEICNKEFEHISSRSNKAKYCSRLCYYKSKGNQGKFTYTCHHCHKEFIGHAAHSRKFCSKKCVGKSNKETWRGTFSTIRKNMAARNMINQCNRCGYNTEPKILGVHHIDRNRKNNDISNLEILCPNCHSLEHLKHISHGFKE